jgi:hypothetical protein
MLEQLDSRRTEGVTLNEPPRSTIFRLKGG